MFITSRLFARVLSAFLILAPLSAAYAVDPGATPAPPVHRKSHKKPAVAPLVLPPLPSGPLRQIPMDQLPSAAPHVTYQNGLLTVAAQNATLSEILGDVRRLTGATVDIPQGSGNERVVTQLGPGAPRDVLAQLLNGTSFNYIMVGTMADPNSVVSVVLTPKPSGGEVQTAANTPPPVATFTPMVPGQLPPPGPLRQQMLAQQGPPPQPPQVVVAEDDNSDDSEDEKDDAEADQTQPAPGQPGMVLQVPDPGADPNQPNAGPKTPEQILQMMRQNQPGNPPNGPGPLNTPPPPHE
jgi:hypothetical protein